MKVSEAKQITGGLSKPSKMPGFSYNLPAYKCITGVKLQKVPGSVCAGCYAMKGRYAFGNVKAAMDKRLASLTHPKWSLAMSIQINMKAGKYFMLELLGLTKATDTLQVPER